MARLSIKADEQGQILSVAKVDVLPKGQKAPFAEDASNTQVVEITDARERANFKEIEAVDRHTGYERDTKKNPQEKEDPVSPTGGNGFTSVADYTSVARTVT